MGKLPYISEAELFTRIDDYKHKEELMRDYNDFFLFNIAQYAEMYRKADEKTVGVDCDDDEIDEETRLAQAERNSKVATDHWRKLFGSKDFGEACMIGLKIQWYDLQKILLAEYKKKTPIEDSAMNGIACYLRNVATIMLLAERMIYDLTEERDGTPEQITFVKNGFTDLFNRTKDEKLVIPEYHAEKKAIGKFKKAEQYIDYCTKLFKGAEK